MSSQPRIIARRRRSASLAAAMVLVGSLTVVQAPAALAVDPSISLEISWTRPGEAAIYAPPSNLRMGDEVTVHVAMDGFSQPGCQTVFAGGGVGFNYPSMWIFSESLAAGGCPDWTFIVPPSPLAEFRIETVAFEGDARASAAVPIVIESGGEHLLFASNYPVSSWSPVDLFGTEPPAFGTPIDVAVPPSATACQLGFNGSFGNGFRLIAPGCSTWTVTLPELRPEFSVSGPYAWPWETGVMVSADGLAPDGRRINGTTYALNVRLDGDGSASTFASSEPAGIFQASNNPHFFERGTVPLTPTLVGVTSGSCEYQLKTPSQPGFSPAGTVPVVDGQCAPVSVDAQEFGLYQYSLRVVRDNNEIASSWAEFEVTVPIPPPTIEIPPDPPAPGEDVPVDVSVPTGPATEYSVAVTLQTAAAAGPANRTAAAAEVAAAATCTGATGQLDVLQGDRDATATCRFGTAGTYRITASMTDALGTTKTSTKLIAVTTDTVAPTPGTVAIAGGAAYSRSTAVTVNTSATDAGSGVSQVALSNDGTTWTTRSYAASQPWALPITNGNRTVHVKWKDGAGNWSAVKTDSIILDTSPPTSTAPTRYVLAGTSISADRVTARVGWAGTDATSGVARYEVQQSTDGGPWSASATLTTASLDRLLATQHRYAFRVRAIDRAGNAGTWMAGPSAWLSRYNETSASVAYTGSWAQTSSSVYWTGGAKWSSRAGSKATFTFNGRSVAFVSRQGPARGKARIYLDGKLVVTLDLYASAYRNQRVVWARTFATSGRHTVSVVVSGTATRPRIDLDAFVVGG